MGGKNGIRAGQDTFWVKKSTFCIIGGFGYFCSLAPGSPRVGASFLPGMGGGWASSLIQASRNFLNRTPVGVVKQCLSTHQSLFPGKNLLLVLYCHNGKGVSLIKSRIWHLWEEIGDKISISDFCFFGSWYRATPYMDLTLPGFQIFSPRLGGWVQGRGTQMR